MPYKQTVFFRVLHFRGFSTHPLKVHAVAGNGRASVTGWAGVGVWWRWWWLFIYMQGAGGQRKSRNHKISIVMCWSVQQPGQTLLDGNSDGGSKVGKTLTIELHLDTYNILRHEFACSVFLWMVRGSPGSLFNGDLLLKWALMGIFAPQYKSKTAHYVTLSEIWQ